MIKSVCWIWKPLSWTGFNVAKKQRSIRVSLCSCFLRFVSSSPHCPFQLNRGTQFDGKKTPQTQQVAGPLLERWAKPVAFSVTPGIPFSKGARRYFQASLEVPGVGGRGRSTGPLPCPRVRPLPGMPSWGRAGCPGTAGAEQPDHPTTRQSSGEAAKTACSPWEAGTYTDAALTSWLGLANGMQFSQGYVCPPLPSSSGLQTPGRTGGSGCARWSLLLL